MQIPEAPPRQKLLIFELRQMGDAVQSLPFVRGAAEVFDVFICCAPSTANLYQFAIPRDRLLCWSAPWSKETGKYDVRRWDWPGLFGILKKLRDLKPDLTVSVWADARDHFLMALSGAAARVGFPMTRTNYYGHERAWRKRQLTVGRILSAALTLILCRRLVNRPLHRRNYFQNHLVDWEQIAEALRVPWRDATPWLTFAPKLSSPVLARVREVVAETGRSAWLIHPGARMPNRRWPAANFEEVIRRVFVPRRIPYLVIQPAECPAPETVGDLGFVMETKSLDDLLEVIGVVGNVLCNDTGISHLSAAQGKTVVTLFSSNRPDWFAPFRNRALVVEKDVCPFRPCLDRCEMPSFICLEAISVDAVVARVEEVIEGKAIPQSSRIAS